MIKGGHLLTMNKFIPSKLNVTYCAPATEFRPIERRKYTFFQSNRTGELFLNIGNNYDFNVINPRYRDEVFAEWTTQMGQYVLSGKMHVSDGEFDEHYAKLRLLIFQREVHVALATMIHGDRSFLLNYPWLLDSPIYIHFDSNFPEFSKMIYYGTPRQYLYEMSKAEEPVET